MHDIDFRRIRAHEGSQHRAWEELAYILAPELDQLPAGTRLIRRATPDGGVEFSCPAPSGRGVGTWAWQAKYLFDFRTTTFQQMKSSFEDALKNTPGLSRYIFVLPEDRPDGAVGASAMKKWAEQSAKWARTAADEGAEVAFEFHGHSEVLTALLRPDQAGTARYFFDTTILSPEAMAAQVSRAITDLGHRYDPALNVKTDFPSLVEGLCLDDRFIDEVGRVLSLAEKSATEAEHALRSYSRAAYETGPAPSADCGVAEGIVLAPDFLADDDPLGPRPVVSPLRQAGDVSAVSAVLPDLGAAIRACGMALDHHDPSRLEATRQSLKRCLDAVAMDKRAHDELSSKRDTNEKIKLNSDAAQTGRTSNDSDQFTTRGSTPAQADVHMALARARSALSTAIGFLGSQTASAASQAAVALVGPAGCGKSHSIADVARERLAAGAPTALILGQQLSVNTSLGAELGHFLQFNAPWSELLSSLQVAAQVAGQGRALLAIDAINEGPGADLWADRLGGFLNEIGQYPLVAVLVSVRDTYESALITDSVQDKVVRSVHRGLAGHEAEAIHLYADYYGLQVSNVPILHPEFSNPLLIRSVCRSAENRGLTSFPTTALGQNWVFDGLLDAVNATASVSLDRDSHDRVVHRAVRQLAERMLSSDSEAISYDDARAACRTVHDDHGQASRSLIAVLEREGILLRERASHPAKSPADPPHSDQIRFTYQRMSDHLRAQTILAQNVDDQALVQAIATLLTDQAWRASGLIESLSALVPDSRGRELMDLVSDQGWFDSCHRQLANALLDSLTWRASSTISTRTITLVREHVQTGFIDNDAWLAALLSLACVPDHPLNVDFLHPRLASWTLIERDMAWSQAVAWIWQNDDNPLARTIDWLWGSCHQLDATGARLVGRLLAWLLSCTSRRLRDSATKVLVEVVDHCPETLPQLLVDFADVNDPYIRERLMAVALGHATRVRTSHLSPSVATLLLKTHEAAIRMASASDHPPHALITHYAQQLTYETRRRLPEVDLAPHAEARAAWPLSPPSNAELRQLFGDGSDRYLPSSPVMYNFREYVLKRGIARDFVPPEQAKLLRRRKANAKARYQRAIQELASATEQTAHEIDRILTTPERRPSLETFRRVRGDTVFPGEGPPSEQLRTAQPDLFFRASRARQDYVTNEPVRVSTELLERHVIARALELGWTPANQGGPDTSATHERWAGQAQDKVERIGKKYSWIAFYELLAVLGQHCAVRRWNDSEEAYASIWQLSHVYDIDPTITLRGDSPGSESASARLLARARMTDHVGAWWLHGFKSPLHQANESDSEWLQTKSDLPVPRRLLSARDPSGDEWIVLESHTEWQKNTPGAAYEAGPHRRDMWVRSQSYLVSSTSVEDIREWSAGKNWMGLWMPTPPDYGLGHYRQYPHGEPWTEWIVQLFSERSDAGELGNPPEGYDPDEYAATDGWITPTERDFPAHPIALTTLGYAANADVDMSAKNLPRGLLPSPLLLRLLAAGPTPIDATLGDDCDRLDLGAVERAYSWSQNNRVVMFGTDGVEWGSPTALFVHAETLEAALTERGLTWWTWMLGEKISWRHGDPTGDRMDMFGAAGLRDGVLHDWHFDSCYYARGDHRFEVDT
ncbi:hypothetical protein HDC34_002346 [Pseudoclavibacter sp. JAI123]|uniref:hypothetical protein n=1 Tax=Pseudoclavibacter sp. JAI123 TaxID=2723065 RepID=UPI0015CDD8E4|nr:hypothetical protein [Pseudoclavibacter sp. JAI123]NYF14052.1 hypothetical protein [Pseudoclavibacter sp. JAI123]